MNASVSDLTPHKQSVLDAARALVNSGILSLSGHGNISVRIPNTDTILLTGGGSLTRLEAHNLTHLTLDGALLEGRLEPVANEIVRMHTEVYRTRANVGCVIHTHSPYATAFAVANVPLPSSYEAMARLDIWEDVPVAAYAPRGSEESVRNIVAAIGPETKAVLLGNHGVLAFAEDARAAVGVCVALEEAAMLEILASGIGGAKPFSLQMVAAARRRRDEFARLGTVRAERS